MRTFYYVTRRPAGLGGRRVHVCTCSHVERHQGRVYLGEFDDAAAAVTAGRDIFADARACPHCCRRQSLTQARAATG